MKITRAELYEKVWATPMRMFAKEFGMSDVGLAKVCRKHNVPVPPVGYWRRKEIGYKVTRPLLRLAKDGAVHLDIYVRERLRPEFEELTRQVPPNVIVTPGVDTHDFRPWLGPRSLAIPARASSHGQESRIAMLLLLRAGSFRRQEAKSSLDSRFDR